MRKIFIYTIVILSPFVSCRAQKIDREVLYGTFNAVDQKYKGLPTYFYTLKLNQDGTFFFVIKFDMASPQCTGKWQVANNEVLLECNESTNPQEALSGGYMSEREHKLQIVSKNKVKYKDVVLKRKKT